MVQGNPRVDSAIAAGAAAAGMQVWRYRGALHVTVVAKATFSFAHEGVMPRIAPRDIFRVEIHHSNSPGRSIRFSADLAPYLPRAEVFFTGHAHAPPAGARDLAPVRLGVFDGARPLVDKSLLVRYGAGLAPVPLIYERAYGGVGWPDNVMGTGVAEGSAEPTILDPTDPRRLAGFAPIGQYWPARRRLLGALKSKSLNLPIAEIPDAFDWSYFQAAPADQRTDFLRGDEWIVMDRLHPSLPLARMRLPGARGLARVHGLSAFGIAEGQPLALHADTLRIDGDEQQCSLTFRGTFPLPGEDALASLQVVAGVELPGEPIVWPEQVELSDGRRTPLSAPSFEVSSSSLEGTLMLDEAGDDAPTRDVPRGRGGAAAPRAIRPAAGKRGGAEPSTAVVVEDSTPLLERTIASESAPERKQTLPFGPVRASSVAGASIRVFSTPKSAPSLSGTMVDEPNEEVHAAQRAVLPFARSTPEPEWLEADEVELEMVASSARLPEPVAPPSIAPVPAPPVMKAHEPEKAAGSPWAPPPLAPTPVPSRPPPPPAQPAASPALKKGLYGKFGGNR